MLAVANDICAKVDNVDAIMKLDTFVGPGIDARIGIGMYRDALALVEAYSRCFLRVDVAGTPAAPIRDRLGRLSCSLPFSILRADGSVDPDAASRGFGMCPAPAVFDGGDRDEYQRWFDHVWNYLELARMVAEPADYVRAGVEYLGRVRASGVASGDGNEDVLAWRVAMAAVVSGNIDSAVSAFGGPSSACTSLNLFMLDPAFPGGVREQDPVMSALAGRATFDSVFPALAPGVLRHGRDCGIIGVAAGVAIRALDSSDVSALVADGRTGDLALALSAAPVGFKLPGDPAARITVLEKALALLDEFPVTRGFRRCELGRALLDAGRHSQADDQFAIARGELPEPEWKLAYAGRFMVALDRPGALVSDSALAARNLFAAGASADELVALVQGLMPGRPRADAVEAMFRAAFATSDQAVAVVADVVVTILDTWPGSPEASRCVALVDEYGALDGDPEVAASWLLLKTRHEIVAGDAKRGFLTLDMALKSISAETPVARDTALPRLVFWMLENGKPDEAVGIVNRAVRSGAVSGAVVASAARLANDKGFAKQAGALFRTARTMKTLDAADWLAIASVAVRLKNVQAAGEAVGRLGPEEDWGYMERMVMGRYQLLKKDYGQAAVEFGRAVEMGQNHPEAAALRGVALMMKGDAAAAEADFRAVLAVSGPAADTLARLAWSVFDQGRFQEAAGLFAAALSFNPSEADYLVGRALALFRGGDLESARASWNLAVAAQPLFSKGPVIAENAGYRYSAAQRKAWIDMRLAMGKRQSKGAR